MQFNSVPLHGSWSRELTSTIALQSRSSQFGLTTIIISDIYSGSSSHSKLVFREVLNPIELKFGNTNFCLSIWRTLQVKLIWANVPDGGKWQYFRLYKQNAWVKDEANGILLISYPDLPRPRQERVRSGYEITTPPPPLPVLEHLQVTNISLVLPFGQRLLGGAGSCLHV